MEYKTRQWHERCFVCCTCKNPIGTKSFIPKDHDIYCAKCYEDKFATKCIKCNKVSVQLKELVSTKTDVNSTRLNCFSEFDETLVSISKFSFFKSRSQNTWDFSNLSL